MSRLRVARGRTLATLASLTLSGCGNAIPQAPASGIPYSPAAQADAPVIPNSTFVAIPDGMLSRAASTGSCGMDMVNNQPANGVPLDHAGQGVFEGWAAERETHSVPRTVWIVLTGTQDFAAPAATGVERGDVASGTGVPAFATSGFRVNVDMDAVPVGEYGVAILYSNPGKQRLCNTNVKVSVQ